MIIQSDSKINTYDWFGRYWGIVCDGVTPRVCSSSINSKTFFLSFLIYTFKLELNFRPLQFIIILHFVNKLPQPMHLFTQITLILLCSLCYKTQQSYLWYANGACHLYAVPWNVTFYSHGMTVLDSQVVLENPSSLELGCGMFQKPHGKLVMWIYSSIRAYVNTCIQISSVLATQRMHFPSTGYCIYRYNH
jgi:hypothetical protein